MKNILILPSQEAKFVKKICNYYKSTFNSNFFALVASKNHKGYQEFITSPEQLIVYPNYYEMQGWETDPNQLEEISEIISKCEMQLGIPLGRLNLINERDIGRAYSREHYYWPERTIVKKVLKNNFLPEIILIRMFKFAYDILQKYKLDLCLGGLSGGKFTSPFYILAEYLNIPFVSCDVTGIFSDRHFWVSGWGSFNDHLEILYKQKLANKETASIESVHFISNFRKNPKLPVLRELSLVSSNLLNVSRAIYSSFLRTLVPIIKHAPPSLDSAPLWTNIMGYCRIYVLARFQKKLYKTFSENELDNLKYIYYPIHQDPEAVLNLRAPFWHSQFNTIKLLSYNLPRGYRLLVREYIYNVGRRPTAYLKNIKQLPGVDLIDPFDNQYKYIARAGLIVTVNGTAGFEGLLLKRPVLTLGRSLYDILDLAHRFDSSIDFGKLILNALSANLISEDYDTKLAIFLDSGKELGLLESATPEEEFFSAKKAEVIL